TVLAKVTVYDKDLKFVRVDQGVLVKSDTLGIEAQGKVAYVGPLIGKETRAAKAHVEIANPEGVWRPGLFIAVHLVQEEFTVPVAVRVEAIQRFRDWDVVFIQDGNLFEAVPLEMGRRNEEWVEVLGGLSAGIKYVSKNSFLMKADILKSGASHDH
ncbi:MAG: efflux RND transporter periplasmic adaptor subunit, partial [Planctomycetes bacterium]|nr:efflux RND transporter periplasmic adaptor subunit [Planctomycetota bacterium]